MLSLFSRSALPATLLAAGLFASACGRAGGPSPTATAEPSPRDASPVPTSQVTPQGATPAVTIEMASASPLLTVLAPDPLDFQTGISSLAAGDFNGDGIGELLIGLSFADGPGNSREDAGEAFVIFGRRGLDGEIDLALEEAGLHILGALPGDSLGFGVASGDLNGDGIDDVIVGAPGSNGLMNIRPDLGEG